MGQQARSGPLTWSWYTKGSPDQRLTPRPQSKALVFFSLHHEQVFSKGKLQLCYFCAASTVIHHEATAWQHLRCPGWGHPPPAACSRQRAIVWRLRPLLLPHRQCLQVPFHPSWCSPPVDIPPLPTAWLAQGREPILTGHCLTDPRKQPAMVQDPAASAAFGQAQSRPPADSSSAGPHGRSPKYWLSSCWAPLRQWQSPTLRLVGAHGEHNVPQRDTGPLRVWGTQETPPLPWRAGTLVDPCTLRRVEGTRWSPPAPCKSPRSCPRSLGEPGGAVIGQSRSLPPAPWPHAPGTSPARTPGTGHPDPRPTPGGRERQPSGRRLRTEPFGE